ncbi:MAG: hypothetical protein K8T90_19010 [Planctomycetes bacterium]|nr:hypothetical protein [Planctomycetota bacterium]
MRRARGGQQSGQVTLHGAVRGVASAVLVCVALCGGPPAELRADERPAAPPAEIPPFLDVNRVTPAQFAGAVSFAMESMRLVYGELTPDDEKKFQAKWRPLFQFCTPKVIDYFNKLNPLLGQFLQVRDAISAVASAFDEAQHAAATAVAVGSAEDLARAMDEAELARREMETLNSALTKVVEQIVALGDPPDAEESARRRRKAHEDALAAVLAPTGRYVRVEWDEPPLPWNEEAHVYGRYLHPTREEDRSVFLDPPGGEVDYVMPSLEFRAGDTGHVWTEVKCRVVNEPYIDMGRLRTDAFYRHADGRSSKLELQNAPESFVPGSSVIEKTRFSGFDAIHFVAEYAYPSGNEWSRREGRDRYEWYAVDVGRADENVWVFVSARLNFSDGMGLPEQVPSADARVFAAKTLQRRWDKQKSICLPEQQRIMDGLRLVLADEVSADDERRFTRKFGERVGAPGRWESDTNGAWRLVAGGNSPTSATLRSESGVGTKEHHWVSSTHTWSSPPAVIPSGGSVSVSLSAVVSQSPPTAAYLAEAQKRSKSPLPSDYGYRDLVFAGRTGASFEMPTADAGDRGGAQARAWIHKKTGPSNDARALRFTPAPGPDRAFARITIGYDLLCSDNTKRPLDDEGASGIKTCEFGEEPTYLYVWDWEPSTKVVLAGGAAATSAPRPARPSAAQPADAGRTLTPEEQAAQAKLDQIEFYKAEMAVQQSDLASLAQQRATARPEDREGLDRRIMWAQDWIQRAQDSITTLQTGNFTRTRTAADEFNLSVMATESRAMADRWDTIHRLIERGPRLIALAPPEEQDTLRKFFDGQVKTDGLATGDPSRFKKVIATLGNRVMGSLEQEQAGAQLTLIDAEERLERAQNVKSVAQTELMLLSLGGGWLRCGYAAIQGVTGYQEGGPGEAAKQVLRAFNQATIAASDAMDAYQTSVLDAYERQAKDPKAGPVDEVRAGLGGAGWVLGKAVALQAGMKYGFEPLGRRLLNLPAPPAKKTLKELAQEMQYLKRRAEGMDTVKLFQEKLADVSRAAKAGAKTADIDRLQSEAGDVYKLIKTDWFAKMHMNELGRSGNLTLLRQYNAYDFFAMKQVKERFEARQAEFGFAKQEYKLFSNSASAGKAGIDVDLGVVEPPRFILNELGKQIPNPARRAWLDGLWPNNYKIGLHEFREVSQTNLEKAFKDVMRYDPRRSAGRESFVSFTTGDHPEAYRDLAWLGKKGMKTADIANVDPAWAGQAAAVTGFKVDSLPQHHPAFGFFATLQEQCRGTVKDFDTKLVPMLSRATNTTAVQHMQDLRGVMDRFARNEIGPVEANRLILQMTGGKGMCEVKAQYAVMLQALTSAK